MKFQYTIYCFSVVLTTAVKAESISKTVTIPFVKAPINKNHPILERRAKSTTEKLFNYQNVGYLVTIDVGTPPQSFDVILDTGSSDTWIPGPSCSSTECPSAKFDSSKSSTFRSLDTNFNITYAIGNATGRYATDTITIGDISVPNQQFGLVSNTTVVKQLEGTNSPDPTYMNGVLGLGFPALTNSRLTGKGGYNPLIFNMIINNLLDTRNRVFSVYLNSSSEHGWSGEITLGGVDSSKYQGEITYLPVLQAQARLKYNNETVQDYFYWAINAERFGLTGSGIKEEDNSWGFLGAVYVFDTGSTLSYFPSYPVKAMIETITGSNSSIIDKDSGAYIIDCNVNSSNELFFTMSDSMETKIRLHVPIHDLLIPTGESQNGAELCIFGIAPIPEGGIIHAAVIIGDSVLRSFYTVFDAFENRIGFASSVGSGSKITSNATKPYMPSNSFAFATISLFITLLITFV